MFLNFYIILYSRYSQCILYYQKYNVNNATKSGYVQRQIVIVKLEKSFGNLA